MDPFLKWAGGKRRLVGVIGNLLPKTPGRLIEPFVGSGAVFLGIERDSYLVGDVNRDLIDLYGFLQGEDAKKFIDNTELLFTSKNNDLESYMRLRKAFNAEPMGTAKRAQLFIYLNRHCFNGLCRYNQSGGFNVPYGKMNNPYFPRYELEGFASVAKRAEFVHGDFREIMAMARPGDAIYCDPPYIPLSATASFGSYAAGGFSMADQEDMADWCRRCAEMGIPVLVSNHDTPETRRIYKGADITEIAVKRSISADGGKRANASEILAVFKPSEKTSVQVKLDSKPFIVQEESGQLMVFASAFVSIENKTPKRVVHADMRGLIRRTLLRSGGGLSAKALASALAAHYGSPAENGEGWADFLKKVAKCVNRMAKQGCLGTQGSKFDRNGVKGRKAIYTLIPEPVVKGQGDLFSNDDMVDCVQQAA